ncbi:putative telomere length regulator protein rif1 [Podospora fimiseda]|uniref:Telomere length regulator protein rif1 n=1 Tax=Podospora fimiseda TaxID=252190 RepID=A0AAN7GYL9_9PEZI|nr:putative telomere length regulator protein rif1 [Podospora fimiseda]
MSSPATVSNVLSTLPPRPPTPPRETHHEVQAPFKHTLDPNDSRTSVHTPPGLQSPSSSITTNSTSRRIRKKVGFSAKAEYQEAPVYREGSALKQHPTPVSLPRSASKPIKSILKVTNHVPNLFNSTNGIASHDSSNPNGNLTTMLESTIYALAGTDRWSKIDAYVILPQALRASSNLPDRVALQEKMGLFMQFMQRDIVSKTPDGAPDSQMVVYALNLLITFLGFPAIASTMTNEFGIFIVDHCIRTFEDASASKDITRRLMQVLSLQNFSSRVMSSDRVGRLVTALHNIDHLKGKSIVHYRVLVYKKLVKQSRQLMIVHSDWLSDLFTDMLSTTTVKDTRLSAISLGLEMAFSGGHEKHLSRKVMELLNSDSQGQRYIQYCEERLKAMVKDKQESVVVPEIWSVVLLLLRLPFDKWDYSTPWLHLIQSCFNSGDFATKIAANRAWNRLVYLMALDDFQFQKHISTLTTPLLGQLKRKGPGKTTEELRHAVLGGICNLFYYTFKPNANPTLMDRYWDRSVKPVIATLLDPASEVAQDNLQQASAILGGLLNCTTPRRWREDRIVDSTHIKPEELPLIDAKWIRRNTTRVFGAVEDILAKDFCALASLDSATRKLWQALVATVAAAAAKEIKVSQDTANFVVEALNVLQNIWTRGYESTSQTSSTEFLAATKAYLQTMTNALGVLPFTDKPKRNPKSPLFSLFSTLSSLPPGLPDDQDFADFLSDVFAPFFASKGEKSKMELAQELLATTPLETPRPFGTWLLVANKISTWLEPGHSSHQSSGSGSDAPVGHNYRDIVKVLERGIKSTPNLPWKPWETLFYALFERVREETGDAGVAILVIEPLSKVLVDQLALPGAERAPMPNSVRCVTELVSVATQPRDKHAVDAARRRLWGTALAGSRSSSFDTFEMLYKAVNEALESQYNEFNPNDTDPVIHLLKEVIGFFERCNRQLFLRSLVALQGGFLPWIQDSNRLLGSQSSAVLAAAKSLWDKLSALIAIVEQPEQQLDILERFFCASFTSCHRSIVNSSVALWNKLFEKTEHLDYPEDLKTTLVQLQIHADIVLPGLESASSEFAGRQPMFIESFDDFELSKVSTRSSSRRTTPRPVSSHSKSPAVLKLAATASRRLSSSPVRKTAASNRRKPTTRLRHDDSQLQFATIDTSPAHVDPLESQVLTERQKEVRERQRENAALFPEIRSSPGKSKDTTRRTESPQVLPENALPRHAATPEPEGTFDDYVSSTPTPRRGQPIFIPENDMTDPPSSPPEPRRNPLAAEIRSRSVSHALIEEWQFSSSPVSGSPQLSPTRNNIIPDPSGGNGYISVVALPEVDVPSSPEKVETSEEPEEPHLPGEEVIEDSMVIEPTPHSQGSNRPSTPPPPASTRETPTPNGGEVYVDAPTSPISASPKRAENSAELPERPLSQRVRPTPTGIESFEFNEDDEQSLLRLVVELDGGKVDPQQYHQSSVSPDTKAFKECIVVGETPKKLGKTIPVLTPVPMRVTRSASKVRTPGVEAASVVPNSQPTKQRGRPKRKRSLTKGQDPNKRTRHESVEEASSQASQGSQEPDEVPDSQPVEIPVFQAQVPEKTATEKEITPEQVEESSSMNQLPVNSSDDLSSPPADSPVEERVSPVLDARDIEVDMEDDIEVQSQIALESFSASQRQEEEEEVEHSIEEAMELDHEQQSPEAEAPAEGKKAQAEAVPPVQEIIEMFRGGLDGLRSAKLSRDEVYKIEDMFMDMKRELYEAERRGRST